MKGKQKFVWKPSTDWQKLLSEKKKFFVFNTIGLKNYSSLVKFPTFFSTDSFLFSFCADVNEKILTIRRIIILYLWESCFLPFYLHFAASFCCSVGKKVVLGFPESVDGFELAEFKCRFWTSECLACLWYEEFEGDVDFSW